MKKPTPILELRRVFLTFLFAVITMFTYAMGKNSIPPPACTTPTFTSQVNSPSCSNVNDGSIDLTLTSLDPVDYSWYSVPSGTNSINQDLTGLPSGPTSYYCLITTTVGGCSATAGPFTISAGPTAVAVYTDNDNDEYGAGASFLSCAGTAGNDGRAAVAGDCNDFNSAIHPGVSDVCNNVDDDCDGLTDEDAVFTVYYVDGDHDGFGAGPGSLSCTNPGVGYSSVFGDCNDADPTVHIKQPYYFDFDLDNYGSTTTVLFCSSTPPAGYSSNFDDCNDNDNTVHYELPYYVDGDGDTYGSNSVQLVCSSTATAGYSTNHSDCNDADISVHAPQLYYQDNDGDGFGSASSLFFCLSSPPAGYVSNSADCDDAHFTYADADGDGFGFGPAIPCGAVTNNSDCDDAHFTYADVDGDGFGAGPAIPCGAVTNNSDCDDANFTYADVDGDGFGAGPALACGAVTNNSDCNDASFTYADADGDGFGAGPAIPCGAVTNNSDCDDANFTYADADGDGFGAGPALACGAVTNNSDCNDASFTYADADGDGFGAGPAIPCGAVTNNSDCDDAHLTYVDNDLDGFGTGAPVPCGVLSNNDCDDNNILIHTAVTYYADSDGDGFGDLGSPNTVCQLSPPSGYVSNSSDCDDANFTYADADGDGFGFGPAIPCGAVTNNSDCDDANFTYADADGDGFGFGPALACGAVTNNSDCDDANFTYADVDGDGFGAGPALACGAVTNNSDCNDASFTYADADGDGFGTGPAIPCGAVTNNSDCNDASFTYADADGDGFGAGPAVACGAVTNNSDCNDASFTYADADGDGFGAGSAIPCGAVTNNSDCDDAHLTYVDNDLDGFGAGAPVPCGVLSNNDCDDNNILIHTAVTYYADSDGDGFGDLGSPNTVCQLSPPSGYVSNSSDCDDANFTYADADGDGFGFGSAIPCGAVTNNSDCDDANFTYADADGDGFGFGPALACGAVTNNSDCDDANFTYADVDGDGFGAGPALACGAVTNNSDCNDASFTYADADGDGFGAGPAIPCGAVTNNSDCDDANFTYADADGDGFGAGPALACGAVTNNSDCNDASFTYADADGDGFGAGSAIPCGAVTNNSDCDDAHFTYADNDLDGYGSTTPVACGGVLSFTDCNDADFNINPGATEVCNNSLDDNCDGNIDEGCICLNPTTANAGNDTTVCAGGNVYLHGQIGGSASNGTWSAPGGTGYFTPSVADLNAVYHPSLADISGGTLNIVLTTDGVMPCVPAVDQLMVVFAALPTNTGPISGTTQFCSPTSVTTANYSIVDIGASSYTWTVPSGINLVSPNGGTSITVSFNTAQLNLGIGGNITVQANNSNGCGSSVPSSLNVTAFATIPIQPGSVSGPDKVCPGEDVIYSVSIVARAVNYNWVVPTGATITSGQLTNIIHVHYDNTFVGGVITVNASNGCGVSPIRQRNVVLNILSAPVSISGLVNGVCGQSNVPYNLPTLVTGAGSYFWSVPFGATISGSNTGSSILVNFTGSYTGGDITCHAVNACGNGSNRALTVLGLPAKPDPISGPLTICKTTGSGPYTLYSVPTVTGASTYTWSVTPGIIIQSGNGSKNLFVWGGVVLSGQTFNVSTSNACGSSGLRNLDNIAIVNCPRIGTSNLDLNLLAYPNPAVDKLNVSFNCDKEQSYMLNVTDATGREVITEVKTASAGTNQIELNVKSLSSGIYMLRFQMDNHTEQIRIFIE